MAPDVHGGQLLVKLGLVPTIHPSTNSGARGALDPRNKPEADR
jgi:hypothetical protein